MPRQGYKPPPRDIRKLCPTCQGTGEVWETVEGPTRYLSADPEFIAWILSLRADGFTHKQIADLPGVGYGAPVVRMILKRAGVHGRALTPEDGG